RERFAVRSLGARREDVRDGAAQEAVPRLREGCVARGVARPAAAHARGPRRRARAGCSVLQHAARERGGVAVNAAATALVVALTAPALAQSRWQFTGGDGTARAAGPTRKVLHGPRASADGLAAGDYEVHFGVDAAG